MTHRFTLATLLACTALLCSTAALAAQRVVLVEELTSQTCPPCYSSNPAINDMIESYGNQVVSVRWHVWWPSPGDDWFYLINQGTIGNRVSVFYTAPTHGAPSLYVDGLPPNPLLNFSGDDARQEIDLRLLIASPMTISGAATTMSASVDVSVDVNVETPVTGPPGQTYRIFAALIEQHVPTGVTYTGTLTAGSAIVTGMSSTRYLVKGSVITGTGVGTGRRVKSVDSATQMTMTATATGSGSQTLGFKSYNNETIHHDVYRTINNNSTPTATGDPIDLSTIGIQHFNFSLPYAADWDTDEFAVVVWVQNTGQSGTGTEVYQAAQFIPTNTLAVADQNTAIAEFGRSFPNPFGRSGTTIPFSLSRTGDVNLAIYDISGRSVRNLVSGQRAAGSYSVRWDGLDNQGHPVTKGVYFARLRTTNLDLSARMVRID
jgi:flagellar hook capping protein FlgD